MEPSNIGINSEINPNYDMQHLNNISNVGVNPINMNNNLSGTGGVRV